VNGYAKATIIGNLTRDPELAYTPKGTAVCKFGIAVNESYTDAAGQKVEVVTFHDLQAWQKPAELLAQYCRKGDPLFVTAKIRVEKWDDKQTGDKRSKTVFVVEEFRFLGGKREADADGGQARESRRTAPARPSTAPPKPAAGSTEQPPEDDDVPF
jgi:single-strand DNA-binding protein